ncbi:MAG: chromate transporter [Bacteroidales bacterium]|nr:chromate transporter [Bacteroidales bacterium]MDD3201045.1 chromate transporter [Bacteroidales bacterium]
MNTRITYNNEKYILGQLFWSFFKIGAFTFGSGYAMIPMIEKEVIDRKKWFEKDDFYNQLTLAQSAPGPIALNTAVFVGYKLKGWIGSLISVLGVVIPSFTILLLVAVYLAGYKDLPEVESAFKGIRPAVIALICVPCIRMMKNFSIWKIAVAVSIAIIIWQLGISPIYFLILGAAAGIIYTFYAKPKPKS